MEDRRRAQRQPAVWMGSCHVEGDSSDLWRECGVFDFSTLGVGMDFRHPGSSDLVGRRISVRLPVGDSVDMTFTGHVRNAKPGPIGSCAPESSSSDSPKTSSTSSTSSSSAR